jgi:2-polyprenyl-3-methyl-5-hydroxy-6-metoxy-1,4-benzoquinol methylase
MKPDMFAQSQRKERRFQFGKNWSDFLGVLDESRIKEAEDSLKLALELDSLRGRKFLDIGCGSGLFSLAARRLGAEVHSFDYDMDSVACCRYLRDKYFSDDHTWIVEQGSVLDDRYMEALGLFDIVYSWGVLHHTGDMAVALENASEKVSFAGLFLVALYNDQGVFSRFWREVKKLYCASFWGKALVCFVFIPIFFMHALASGLIFHGSPVAVFVNYKKKRGMSIYHDWLDWLGGYPFETARVDEIVCLFLKRGFSLQGLKTTIGWGCNEFVFQKGKCQME